MSPAFFQKSPVFYQKAPVFYQKSPIFYQMSPAFFQKSPVFYQKASVFYQKSPIFYQMSPAFFQKSPILSPAFYQKSPIFFQEPSILYAIKRSLCFVHSASRPHCVSAVTRSTRWEHILICDVLFYKYNHLFHMYRIFIHDWSPHQRITMYKCTSVHHDFQCPLSQRNIHTFITNKYTYIHHQ